MDDKLNLLKKISIQAGNSIMKIYETDFDVEYKGDDSPLTLTDKKANNIIVSALKEEYPNYAILAEESRDDKSRFDNDYCFIVEPLDGTKESIKRNGQSKVNIALAYKGKPILGVIYVPVTKQLYYAAKGEGAYLENIESGKVTELKISNKLDNLICVGSKSHSSEKEESLISGYKEVISDTISAGSSLKGFMVAEGKAEVYYRFGLTSECDTAAIQCIVDVAEGIFRQMDGIEMLYNRENNLNEKGFCIFNKTENIWI